MSIRWNPDANRLEWLGNGAPEWDEPPPAPGFIIVKNFTSELGAFAPRAYKHIEDARARKVVADWKQGKH